MLTSIGNPILLLVIGLVFTALAQSSTAITAILISMAAAGIQIGNGGNSILFVILGTNIGTCVTALMSSVGANTNAKRASMIHKKENKILLVSAIICSIVIVVISILFFVYELDSAISIGFLVLLPVVYNKLQ